MFFTQFSNLCKQKGKSVTAVGEDIGISKTTISYWRNTANVIPKQSVLIAIANYFGVSIDYLLNGNNGVKIDDDYVTFAVVGDVAAGYNHIAAEDWNGDTVNIPTSFLKGRDASEFFVLRVTGDSMYPLYMDGDKVLVLKQSTLNHSGQVGVVLYNGDIGTLKRVEYVNGEDWMRLVPINPNYPPVTISNSELENCKVLGIPKLLIREIPEK